LEVVFILLWIHTPFDEGKGSKTAKSTPNNENDQFQDAEQGKEVNQSTPQIAEKTKYCHIHVCLTPQTLDLQRVCLQTRNARAKIVNLRVIQIENL
jgi:hypothetical protein